MVLYLSAEPALDTFITGVGTGVAGAAVLKLITVSADKFFPVNVSPSPVLTSNPFGNVIPTVLPAFTELRVITRLVPLKVISLSVPFTT